MEWIYVVIAGLLEVLSINYMNKWQLVKHNYALEFLYFLL